MFVESSREECLSNVRCEELPVECFCMIVVHCFQPSYNLVIHFTTGCILFSNKVQNKLALEASIYLYLIGHIGWVKSDHSEAI